MLGRYSYAQTGSLEGFWSELGSKVAGKTLDIMGTKYQSDIQSGMYESQAEYEAAKAARRRAEAEAEKGKLMQTILIGGIPVLVGGGILLWLLLRDKK